MVINFFSFSNNLVYNIRYIIMVHTRLYDRQSPIIRSVLDGYNKLTITPFFSMNLYVLEREREREREREKIAYTPLLVSTLFGKMIYLEK